MCTSSLYCSTGVNRGNDNSGRATDSKVMFRNVRMLGHSSIQTGSAYFKWQGAKSNACLTRAKTQTSLQRPIMQMGGIYSGTALDNFEDFLFLLPISA